MSLWPKNVEIIPAEIEFHASIDKEYCVIGFSWTYTSLWYPYIVYPSPKNHFKSQRVIRLHLPFLCFSLALRWNFKMPDEDYPISGRDLFVP